VDDDGAAGRDARDQLVDRSALAAARLGDQQCAPQSVLLLRLGPERKEPLELASPPDEGEMSAGTKSFDSDHEGNALNVMVWNACMHSCIW
jgi:hypothetical protein